MTVLLSHYNQGKLKRVAQGNTKLNTRISKNSVMSLLMVQYTLFLRQLLKTANNQARSDRSKITKGQHINAIAKKILRKYRR